MRPDHAVIGMDLSQLIHGAGQFGAHRIFVEILALAFGQPLRLVAATGEVGAGDGANLDRVSLDHLAADAGQDGRIAAEGALPYPPGVLCVVPGEVWGGSVLRYFAALEEGINLLPGFAPELQGVYVEECDGRKQVRCNVIKQSAAQPSLLKGEKL